MGIILGGGFDTVRFSCIPQCLSGCLPHSRYKIKKHIHHNVLAAWLLWGRYNAKAKFFVEKYREVLLRQLLRYCPMELMFLLASETITLTSHSC